MTRPNYIAVFQPDEKGHSVKMETNGGRQLINEAIDALDKSASQDLVVDAVIVPRVLVEQIRAALVWSGDEVTELRENLDRAVRLSVRQATHIVDLEDEIAEHERAELVADQRLDYWVGAR